MVDDERSGKDLLVGRIVQFSFDLFEREFRFVILIIVGEVGVVVVAAVELEARFGNLSIDLFALCI